MYSLMFEGKDDFIDELHIDAWDVFINWADTLDKSAYPGIVAFAKTARTDNMERLNSELESALAAGVPKGPRFTINELLSALKHRHGHEEFAVVHAIDDDGPDDYGDYP